MCSFILNPEAYMIPRLVTNMKGDSPSSLFAGEQFLRTFHMFQKIPSQASTSSRAARGVEVEVDR